MGKFGTLVPGEREASFCEEMHPTGGLLVGSPAVFTHDNRYIAKYLLFYSPCRCVVVCSDKRVKLYDAISGELLKVFGTKYELSGAVLDPTAPQTKLLCVGKSGEVLSVPMVEGDETRLLGKVDRGLGSIITSSSLVFALSSDRQKVYQIVLSDSQRPKIFPVVKGNKAICGIACNGSRLAYASGKRLWVWDCEGDVNRKAVETVEVPHAVTALAWFGAKELVLGYAQGAMAVIRELETGSLAAALERQTQSLHWHSDTVRALSGSLLDGYVLSGGSEGVGVQWGLGRGASGVRSQFLPRLGAPILWACASGDGSRWILGLENNSLVVVGSEGFRPVCTIRGLASEPAFIHVSPHDPGHVLVPSGFGNLQTFDAIHDKSIDVLSVTHENVISALPEDRAAMKHRRVRLVAHHGTKLMATFESYDDEGEGFAGTLRIWHHVPESLGYQQMAVIDAPHGNRAGPLTALCFKPSAGSELGAQLVTVDGLGQVRLWEGKTGHWSGSSKLKFGHKLIADMDCSEDGSLLAMACGPSVLLVDGRSMTFLRALTYSRTDAMQSVRFLGLSGLLACHDGAQLSVWNLETCGLAWSLEMPVRSMAVRGTKLAVAFPSPSHPGEDYTVLFRAASPIPVLARRHPSCRFCSLLFLQAKRRDAKTKTKSVLFGLTNDGLMSQAFPEAEPVDDPVITSGPSWGRTSLAKELMASADVALEHLQPTEVPPQWDAPRASPRDLLLMETPSHVLPSMRLLAAAFFKLRLPPA